MANTGAVPKKIRPEVSGDGGSKSTSTASTSTCAPFKSIPQTTWKHIYGLQETITELKEILSDLQGGLYPTYNILLYGPAGCGKTRLAQAFANQCQYNFYNMKAQELINNCNTMPGQVKDRFRAINQSAPCVLFMDEIHELAKYDEVTKFVEKELDDLENIIIIAAIENLSELPCMLLPPRCYKTICVPLPNENDRKLIFLANIANYNIDTNINMNAIAMATQKFSGADIVNLCHSSNRAAKKNFNKERKNANAGMTAPLYTPHAQPPISQAYNPHQPAFPVMPGPSTSQGLPQSYVPPSFMPHTSSYYLPSTSAPYTVTSMQPETPKITFSHIEKAIKTISKSINITEINEFEIIAPIFLKLREFLLDIRNNTFCKQSNFDELKPRFDKQQAELTAMVDKAGQAIGSVNKVDNIRLLITHNFQANRNTALTFEQIVKNYLVNDTLKLLSEEDKLKLLQLRPKAFVKELENLRKKEANLVSQIVS